MDYQFFLYFSFSTYSIYCHLFCGCFENFLSVRLYFVDFHFFLCKFTYISIIIQPIFQRFYFLSGKGLIYFIDYLLFTTNFPQINFKIKWYNYFSMFVYLLCLRNVLFLFFGNWLQISPLNCVCSQLKQFLTELPIL